MNDVRFRNAAGSVRDYFEVESDGSVKVPLTPKGKGKNPVQNKGGGKGKGKGKNKGGRGLRVRTLGT